MSFKTGLIKMAIKLTPNAMIVWVANIVLKDIAELKAFNFDLDTRTVYSKTQLLGEPEAIEIWIEDFAIISDENGHSFIVNKAESNRLWLNNILARFVGKAWKIPSLPQFASQIDLVAELLKAETPAPAEQPELPQLEKQDD